MRSRKKWKKSNRNRQTPTIPCKTGIFYGKRSTPKVNKAVFCVVWGNVFRIDVFDVLVVVLFSFFFFLFFQVQKDPSTTQKGNTPSNCLSMVLGVALTSTTESPSIPKPVS